MAGPVISQPIDVSKFPSVNAAMGGAHGLCLFTVDGSTWTAMLVRADFTTELNFNPTATGATGQAAIAALFALLVSSTAATAAATATAAQTAASVAAAVSGAAKGP